jgi:hypothetical protein
MTTEHTPHEDIERNAQVIENFRASGNDRLLLLTTTGRKTARRSPPQRSSCSTANGP